MTDILPTTYKYKRDDRVEIIGPDDQGVSTHIGLHGRVINSTESTGAFWLHSLEEKWYIPGFFPAASLRLLPALPVKPSYPTCQTCKHWGDDWVDDLTDYHPCMAVAHLEEGETPATSVFTTAKRYVSEMYTSGAHGCLLHSDLAEAKA